MGFTANDNFSIRATFKPDDELHYCIDNREKYLPETAEAAVVTTFVVLALYYPKVFEK